MKRLATAIAAAVVVAVTPLAAADPVNQDQLVEMVTGMGFTPKPLVKTDGVPTDKYEILVVTEGFNVPIGLELSKSGRFIWCTASLGPSKLTGDDALEVLKRISQVQPSNFWITSSGVLTIGIAVDNREVTPAYLKFIFDKLAADVGSTADLWQKPDAE